MSKHKLIGLIVVIFLAVFCIGMLVVTLVNKDSSETFESEDDIGVLTPIEVSDFNEDITNQTNDIREQFDQGTLEFSDENSNNYFYLITLFEDSGDYDNVIKLANNIPNSAGVENVRRKYESLLEATRLTQKLDEYETYRNEYLVIIESNEEQTRVSRELFERMYPTRAAVEEDINNPPQEPDDET